MVFFSMARPAWVILELQLWYNILHLPDENFTRIRMHFIDMLWSIQPASHLFPNQFRFLGSQMNLGLLFELQIDTVRDN